MLRLEGFYHEHLRTTMVFPYLSGNHMPSTPKSIQSYMRQLLQALSELAIRDVVHCNIKPDNVIFDEFRNLTLIDFESAVRRHELIDQGKFCKSIYYDDLDRPEYKGNPLYCAPEVLVTQKGRNSFGNTLYG